MIVVVATHGHGLTGEGTRRSAETKRRAAGPQKCTKVFGKQGSDTSSESLDSLKSEVGGRRSESSAQAA